MLAPLPVPPAGPCPLPCRVPSPARRPAAGGSERGIRKARRAGGASQTKTSPAPPRRPRARPRRSPPLPPPAHTRVFSHALPPSENHARAQPRSLSPRDLTPTPRASPTDTMRTRQNTPPPGPPASKPTQSRALQQHARSLSRCSANTRVRTPAPKTRERPALIPTPLPESHTPCQHTQVPTRTSRVKTHCSRRVNTRAPHLPDPPPAHARVSWHPRSHPLPPCKHPRPPTASTRAPHAPGAARAPPAPPPRALRAPAGRRPRSHAPGRLPRPPRTHWPRGAQPPLAARAPRRWVFLLLLRGPARPGPTTARPDPLGSTHRGWKDSAPGTAVSPPQPECAARANGGARR